MLDYSTLLYDPVYAEIGVPATFTQGSTAVQLTVIDDTRPKTLPGGSLQVTGVGPGAWVRIPELNAMGVMRGDYLNAILSFNGRNWTVRSYELRGSPNGEDFGEVRFLLKEASIANGGSSYAAKAVHFDGMTWLSNSSMTATDSNFLSVSYWFKNTTGGPIGENSNMNAGMMIVVDSENNYTTFIDNLQSGNDIRFSLENDAGNRGVNVQVAAFSSTVDTNWHHILFTGQTGQASGSNVCKLYYDGMDAGTAVSDQGPFGMVFNGRSFWVGADSFGGGAGSGIIGDIADFWCAPDVSLLVAGDIPPATLALFRSGGKPADPANFPVGAAVLFSGDASTFATNKGTGGAFTLTGALGNATTSPSDG